MLFTIAWRNVWRNRLRSLVVIMAIASGLALGLFFMAFSFGMNEQRAKNIVETQTSHIQVHSPAFKEDQETQYFLEDGQEVLQTLANYPEVKASTGRLIVNGMLSNPKGGFGVQIMGIDPAEESQITHLDDRMIAGDYFEGSRSKPIVVGEKLAEKLGYVKTDGDSTSYRLRKKVVLTFQNGDSTFQASFRIVGLYKTVNSKYDEMVVFVDRSDMQELLGKPDALHQVAALLNTSEQVDTVKQALQAAYPDDKVESWLDLNPDLKMVDETFDVYMRIFIGIILLALSFGIINTMLMAVLERTRELGMLMSVGMNKAKIFLMIMLETVFMTVAGAPIGLLIGWGLITTFNRVGIDLSSFSEGLSSFGMENIVYPEIDPTYYGEILIMVVIAALLSALYPAFKALSLKPSEAVRAL
ncbi:FtsX-like permease family protein [Pontibacter sp. G13]|uniref:ABC transporter permease n=1 Tax=Pontibacter sp. G13 TaxID=3074898 RepID=UPI00288A60B9|nr:FtsX-like permease family protein [Pontibacter sp. G13]WNJ18597.1 FtsX-like permease family protein [Pontibacter sp. G13]